MATIKNYMFETYQNIPEDYIPNNTFPLLPPPDGLRDIVRGTTPEHFLHVPFKETDLTGIIVTYKQGYHIVEKFLADIRWGEYDSEGCGLPGYIYYKLTSDETASFEALQNEPCKIQVKVFIGGDSEHEPVIQESDIYQVSVLEVLNDKELVYGE